jgi:regulator of nonsense transcripts 2
VRYGLWGQGFVFTDYHHEPTLGDKEVKSPLDSSLKKHTTLLNRLRSALLTTSAETFLKELDGLTLTKYTEEIRTAVLEGISGTAAKGKADVEGAVEVGSA